MGPGEGEDDLSEPPRPVSSRASFALLSCRHIPAPHTANCRWRRAYRPAPRAIGPVVAVVRQQRRCQKHSREFSQTRAAEHSRM
jgi:hypothetical protein